uniref:Non-structural protein NSP1 n=1 Tax=Rotavirus A RVA/Raccoon-tc/JPN/Rac-311/2011/G34P[17] TaxID=1935387 RepID=A0A2Z6FBF1_9REOV|nr:non-structural protein NSP1 [Rotavirus A RVA/Raccoon-tc/JPN/Rac-311/2011/G34P[17]]
MASNQLRFEYSVVKFSKSSFTSTLKPITYTSSMQWCVTDKLNKHLWRTFNRTVNHDLPIGNCWTCGLLHNVYSCDFCNVNHICRSCKENRVDVCPFAGDKLSRFAHDMIKIDNCDQLDDDILLAELLPLYERYYNALLKVSTTAVWKELKEKRRRGLRMHTLSSVAVDFNDCYLPTNILAFKSHEYRSFKDENVTAIYLLFGHYEPHRNREQNISYTNINLKHYKKTYDAIIHLNLQLAINRNKSLRPMVTLDITPNKHIPYINDQAYICQLNESQINYALIRNDFNKWLLCRPILKCLSPMQFVQEIFTAWLTVNPRVQLSRLEQQHYSSIFRLSSSIKWPNRHESYIGYTYFSYYENLVSRVLTDIADIKAFSRASTHYLDHAGFFNDSCELCCNANELLCKLKSKTEQLLMKECCYHATENADIASMFSINHRLNHDELLWRTDFDLRAMILHNARIARSLLMNAGLVSEYHEMPDWSDWTRSEFKYLDCADNIQKLDTLQKCWAVCHELRLRICRKLDINLNCYKIFEIVDEELTTQISVEDEENYEIVERPNSYRWLKDIIYYDDGDE